MNFTAARADTLLAARDGWLERLGCQYHWHNRGYRDFQDFLEALSSRKRKHCLLYTSDAADEEDSVDLGGRRIIKKLKE